jgi:hypothetical protein
MFSQLLNNLSAHHAVAAAEAVVATVVEIVAEAAVVVN